MTLVSNTQKIWARGPMPPSLDEALDFLSAEYAVQMPTADLLYSSPYDAMMTPESERWLGRRPASAACRRNHLAYQQGPWTGICSVSQRCLPCPNQGRLQARRPGKPTVTVTYRNVDLSPQVSDETFVARFPKDTSSVEIMRHATVEAPSGEGESRQGRSRRETTQVGVEELRHVQRNHAYSPPVAIDACVSDGRSRPGLLMVLASINL